MMSRQWVPAVACRSFGAGGDPRGHLNPDGTRPSDPVIGVGNPIPGGVSYKTDLLAGQSPKISRTPADLP